MTFLCLLMRDVFLLFFSNFFIGSVLSNFFLFLKGTSLVKKKYQVMMLIDWLLLPQLFGKPIRVNKASAHQKNLDVGANIFIGNLDPEVDEKLLYDTFSAFGVILQTPKVRQQMYGRVLASPCQPYSHLYLVLGFAAVSSFSLGIGSVLYIDSILHVWGMHILTFMYIYLYFVIASNNV